ncbi:uncharacterized protein BDZ99DRAFT_194066 [Mytilinidion resinicola]|uniref:Uncharacterized protein n=1 Tax=Mytilinidion resinicola TaxID=574789 RepID=A0A6A6Z3E6_9PEZI|nr:uncharacterized protein BDZ99DRAFT_194066 [Mytilinidion resinicola]KAF2815328.1 hypothetical protein BDZ99DRAFT_194066 [Mytilinidion resinicola]
MAEHDTHSSEQQNGSSLDVCIDKYATVMADLVTNLGLTSFDFIKAKDDSSDEQLRFGLAYNALFSIVAERTQEVTRISECDPQSEKIPDPRPCIAKLLLMLNLRKRLGLFPGQSEPETSLDFTDDSEECVKWLECEFHIIAQSAIDDSGAFSDFEITILENVDPDLSATDLEGARFVGPVSDQRSDHTDCCICKESYTPEHPGFQLHACSHVVGDNRLLRWVNSTQVRAKLFPARERRPTPDQVEPRIRLALAQLDELAALVKEVAGDVLFRKSGLADLVEDVRILRPSTSEVALVESDPDLTGVPRGLHGELY